MGNVINIQQSGGLGITQASDDSITGLVIQVKAAATGGTYVLGTPYKLRSIAEANALGLNEAFDVTNASSVYQPIKEFFQFNSNATLYIMLVADTVTAENIFQIATEINALKLVSFAGGQIKQLGAALNPPVAVTDYEEYLTDAIAQAQLFSEHCSEQRDAPLHVLLEGYGMDGTTDLLALNASKVSVMIGQNVANTSTDHTAIGTLLGVVSSAAVNECVGWVGKFNVKGGDLQSAKVLGTELSATSPSVLTGLDEKGYIFFKTYNDYAGIYLNDSHTCTVATDDYSKIEMNRTWNKASRLIRSAELPYVNSPVTIDTTTGQIDPLTVATLEAVGNKALRPMFANGEISGPDPQGATPPVQIDPAQDVLATSNINIQVSIVPTGTARTITNYIGLKNPTI